MNAKKVSNPATLVPGGTFSQVVRSSGKTTIFISAQVSRDKDGKTIGKGNFSLQAKQTLTNLKLALESEGASMGDVVKLTTYLIDMRNLQELYKIRAEFLKGTDLPAATLVGVNALPDPDYMISIDAEAVLP